MTQGPNVRKLIAEKIAADAIGVNGGLGAALNFLKSKERIMQGYREATAFVSDKLPEVASKIKFGTWPKVQS